MEELKSRLLESKPEDKSLFTLSVSKCKTFKDCPAKYRYVYIEKLPRKEYSFHIFGKFLHEVLENFYKERIAGSTDQLNLIMGKCFKNAFNNWKDKITPGVLKEAKDILSGYLKKLSLMGDKAPTVLTAEKPFWIDIDGKILLNGFIDRTQRDYDGILHISDYKSTKNKKYLKDFFQLMTYAFVMMLEDPSLEKVRTSYILLRHDCEVMVKEYTRKEVMEVENVYLEWAKNIHAEKLFRPKPTPLCSFCEHSETVCEVGANFIGKPIDSKFGETKW